MKDLMMTLSQSLRATRLAPTLLLATFLIAAGCASGPSQPPLSPSSGEARVPVDPSLGEPDPEEIEEIFDEVEEEEVEEDEYASAEDLTPPHLDPEDDLKRAAVLLPFSHSQSRVRSEAEGMLAAIELALFDQAGENFLILPKDTSGRPEMAAERAKEAISEDVDVIIGPLFGSNVEVVNDIARKERVPVIAFSNDRNVAGNGAYLVSITPESEVNSVVQYASRIGVRSYAFLGPDTSYGRRVESALRSAAAQNGGSLIVSRTYGARGEGQEQAAQGVAAAIENQPEGTVAIMIPEQGTRLRSVAPLLPYNGVDVRKLKLLGTGQWNDPSVWREPTLFGGIFAAPEPSSSENFKNSYQRIYGSQPRGLASLGYDAAALAIQLAEEDNLSTRGVTDRQGFVGTNGLFRLGRDGLPDRGLAILEISPEGVGVVQPGARDFTGSGS